MTDKAIGTDAGEIDGEHPTEDDAQAAREGEADEPDAPTAEVENEGMNTILSATPLTGVQDDASDG
jgi:hypothetical protein